MMALNDEPFARSMSFWPKVKPVRQNGQYAATPGVERVLLPGRPGN
ncbi:MAG: hypothetical protein R2932_17305 [Caldilineaceae bacterium]